MVARISWLRAGAGRWVSLVCAARGGGDWPARLGAEHRPDGHVEIVAAGEKELAELKMALRKGSRGSRVDAVVEHELAESEGATLGPFEIEGAW